MAEDWREQMLQERGKRKKKPKKAEDHHDLPPLGAFVECKDGFLWQVQNHVPHTPSNKLVRKLPTRAHVTAPKAHAEGCRPPVWRWISAERIARKDWGYKAEDLKALAERGIYPEVKGKK